VLTLQVGIVSGRYDANDPASPLQLLLGDVGPMLAGIVLTESLHISSSSF
jgi:hypothetical protein